MTLNLRNAEIRDSFLDLVREAPVQLHARTFALLEAVVFKNELEEYVGVEVVDLTAELAAEVAILNATIAAEVATLNATIDALNLQDVYDAKTAVPQITVDNGLPLTVDLTSAAQDVFALRDDSNADIFRASDVQALVGVNLKTLSGKIEKTSHYTTTQTLDSDDHIVFCNTDGGDWTLTLPAGVEGTHYKICNTGTSGNTLSVDPNASDGIYGAGDGVAQDVADGEVMDLHFNSTDGGWW